MNDLLDIEILTDLFPAKPRSELASRLLCSLSVEILIEEIFLEQASAPTGSGYTDHVKNLKLMFPDHNFSDIAAELQRNNNDLDATIHRLMLSDTLGQLSQVLGLPTKKVKPYLDRHKNDFFKALADIVAHYRVQKRAWTSRVQDRKSAALEDAYTFGDNKNETQELNQYFWAEKSLQQLNYDFLVKLLTFFQGDVFKVLDLARLFIESKKALITYEHNLGFETRSPPKQNAPTVSEMLKLTSQQKLSKLPVLGTPSSAVPSMGIAYNSRTKKHFPSTPSVANIPSLGAPAAIEPTLDTAESRVDLHGYTVAEAKSITTSALDAWWRRECELRIADGLLHKHGAKVNFVPPLVIITGRGLHSYSGPKLRSSVLRILKDGNFIFEEGVGNVTVLGKKK